MKKLSAIFLALSFILLSLSGCRSGPKQTLVVFAAGSLINPFNELEVAFEADHPDVDVQTEYHGSIQVIRHASELHEPIDVVASADAALIPMLMYNTFIPGTDTPYATWYIRFATNKLSIGYTDQSRYADEIDADNWYEILARKDVKVGIADPRFDASGYRALMAYALAGIALDNLNIFGHMFGGQFAYPFKLTDNNGVTVIHVPEIVETYSGSHIVIRGSSIELIALLESGDLDYAFEYDSVIRQHGFNRVEMPDQFNLSVLAQNDFYQNVRVEMDFQRFATVQPVFNGEQIRYGITIPASSPNPDMAAEYIAFVLGPKGQEIMARNYQPLLEPVIADGVENLPDLLKSFASP